MKKLIFIEYNNTFTSFVMKTLIFIKYNTHLPGLWWKPWWQFVLGQSRPKFVTYEMKSNVPHLSGQDRTVLLNPEQLWIATKSVGQDCPSPGVVSFVIIEKYNHLPH